jgi:hypothetical protein
VGPERIAQGEEAQQGEGSQEKVEAQDEPHTDGQAYHLSRLLGRQLLQMRRARAEWPDQAIPP